MPFFSGTVPTAALVGGPGLEDNFSTNLHISQVRILKVKKQTLPLKSKSVQDAIPARPSRLVFISNFQSGASVFENDGNHCYADSGKVDGDFDLTRCRLAAGNITGPSLGATPTYLAGEASMLLTWIAEFRESEGGVLPPIDSETEVLVIEFTIEANPMEGS